MLIADLRLKHLFLVKFKLILFFNLTEKIILNATMA